MEIGRANLMIRQTRYKLELAMATYRILVSISRDQGTEPQHLEAVIVSLGTGVLMYDALSKRGIVIVFFHHMVKSVLIKRKK